MITIEFGFFNWSIVNRDGTVADKILETIKLSGKFTPAQLARLIKLAAGATFATDPLEVDETLWGGFWHGDVIGPGYTLPAVELALLRATRLEQHWPEGTTVAAYIADLRRAIRHTKAGVWTLTLAGEPCAIFASVGGWRSVVMVWYCLSTGHLHAGYQATADTLNFLGAVAQRPFDLSGLKPLPPLPPPGWLARRVKHQPTLGSGHSVAAQLDAEILQIRWQGYYA